MRSYDKMRYHLLKLEQLECLLSENTPRRPMITHTMDSYQIPWHNKTKSKLQIPKICQKFKFWNFAITFTRDTTFWSCLIRCANMKWIRLVLWKIQSGQDFVHRQTDRRTDDVKPVYPTVNFVGAGGIMIPGILLDLLIVCILHRAGKPLHQLVLLPFLIQLKNVHKKNTQVSYEASFFNSSPAGQYGRHFADDIFRCISWMKIFVCWVKFRWSLFPITQHWFR